MSELNPCPCGGKMELLNDQRHLKQRVSRERYEIVCAACGLTVKHPSKSTHKLIALWNTPDTEIMEALEKIMSYTKLGIGSISRIRSIAGKAISSKKPTRNC